jgi:hypothetical protein
VKEQRVAHLVRARARLGFLRGLGQARVAVGLRVRDKVRRSSPPWGA